MSLLTGSRPPVRRPPTAVSWVLVGIGALIVAGAVVVAVVQLALTPTGRSQTVDATTDGMTKLDASVDAGSFTVTYADATRATLRVTSGAGWTLRRDGSVLRVTGPANRALGWPFGSNGSTAVLTLPYSVETADYDASVQVGAGDLTMSGEYRNLAVRVDSGTARIAASATSARAELESGDATLDLAGVRSGTLQVDAGSLDATLTGSQPNRVSVSVDSGDADVTLPDGSYAVSSDVSAGDLADHLTRDPASMNRVDVQVSAGSVSLR